MGKREIWTAEEVAAARPDVAYHVFDAGSMAEADPALFQACMAEILPALATGEIAPPPLEVLPLTAAQVALRRMAQAKHMGKLVLALTPSSADLVPVRSDGAYLISGGLGGVGLAAARWLAKRGARRVILIGRHAPDASVSEAIDGLKSRGVAVRVVQADIADREAMAAVIAETTADASLRGIIHAAGSPHNGLVRDLDAATIADARRGKVEGAEVLRALTRGMALDFVVLCTAAANMFGASGQGAYAAANAELAALGEEWRREGAPVASIAWGPWRDAGMFAAMSERAQAAWKERGLIPMGEDEAFAALERALAAEVATSPCSQGRLASRTHRRRRQQEPFLLRGDAGQGATAEAPPPVDHDGLVAIRALPGALRRNALIEAIAARARIVLDLPKDAAFAVGASAQGPRPRLPDGGRTAQSSGALRRRGAAGDARLRPSDSGGPCRPAERCLVARNGSHACRCAEGIGRRRPRRSQRRGCRSPARRRAGSTLRRRSAVVSDPQSTVKRALLELRTLRGRLEATEGRLHAPVAVIGMGLRLPGGVEDAEGLEQLLWGGVDAIGDIPADRWPLEALFDADPDAPGKMSTRFGGFLKDVDKFDAAFFGISPREAASMDPQQRLLLELAWESLENAAVAPDSLNGSRLGVYVGLGNVDYSRATFSNRHLIDPYFATGVCSSVAAGRISYTLGVTGPAATIDTACSSSLVALHMACQALRLGECDAALAGGVNLILTPEMNISFSKSRMMAPDGRCKTFDAAADGYVRAEGGVVLMLKLEADARAAGDRILAVVRGSAINQDGRSNGITAPNGPSQEAVIRAALANAGVTPSDIGYVEAHGTGTPLGDPIEIGALQAVYGQAGRTLPVGSIKTNIGHTEAAAGLAGVAKVILALQKASIPPSLNFKTGNPHIDWSAGIAVATAVRPFPRDARGRLVAGVSAFGFSGTNAHVILEAAQTTEAQEPAMERPAHVLALSARTDEGLRALAGRWKARFEAGDAAADLCHTANVGRAQLDRRAAIVGQETSGLRRFPRHARARQGRAVVAGQRGRRRRDTEDRLSLHRPGCAFRRHGPRALRDVSDVPRGAGRLRRRRSAAPGRRAVGRDVLGRSGGAGESAGDPAGGLRSADRTPGPLAFLGRRTSGRARPQPRRIRRRLCRRDHVPGRRDARRGRARARRGALRRAGGHGGGFGAARRDRPRPDGDRRPGTGRPQRPAGLRGQRFARSCRGPCGLRSAARVGEPRCFPFPSARIRGG